MGDDSLLPSLEAELAVLSDELDRLKPIGPDDDKPAFLTITAGSGGREAMDWARMLLRMYDRFIRDMGMDCDCVYLDVNDDGGIRTTTLRVSGAFGRLASEAGIHKLSRVSPFDHADRRQTSFAKVEVISESDAKVDDVDIDVREEDLKTIACKGGGPGGQAKNKTSNVIVMKHLPTGIVVRCQNGRSQLHNRKTALALLKSKLAKIAKDAVALEDSKRRAEAPRASFGCTCRRTYVLSQHPMIYDHVTGVDCALIQEVLDGNLGLLEE